MLKEIHLFIIWSKARDKKNEIIKDIKTKFEILEIYNIKWSKYKFSENLSRFYGENLPKNSHKEKHCGNGVFTCIIVKDNNPLYDVRVTSKGNKMVNINLFDAKQLYRKWTGGGHKIHATDNVNETKLQLILLLNKTYNYYYKFSSNLVKEKEYNEDLVGANGWNSFEELFNVLNETISYVFLRNFENVEHQLYSNHPDIDLLVENRNLAINILNAKITTKYTYRTQYNVIVSKKNINFDLRYIGDDYYDINFQYDLINNRIKYKYFYIPNDELLLYSLIYHALIHKNSISTDYIDVFIKYLNKLNIRYDKSIFIDINLFEFLLKFLYKYNYKIVEPIDLTVGFNTTLIYQRLYIKKSLKRDVYNKKIMIKSIIKKIIKKLNIK